MVAGLESDEYTDAIDYVSQCIGVDKKMLQDRLEQPPVSSQCTMPEFNGTKLTLIPTRKTIESNTLKSGTGTMVDFDLTISKPGDFSSVEK